MGVSLLSKRSVLLTLLKRSLVWTLALMAFLLLAGKSFAFVYPEHRDIAILGVQDLDPERRATLDRVWAEARMGFERRLCEQVADADQGEKTACIDWAAWSAIAGDHSCSSEDMVKTVLETGWILKVADVTARLKRHLTEAKNRSRRVNYVRDSDLELQRADTDYATRAGSNNVHFLLARPSLRIEGVPYVTQCLSAGTELNALGAYAWYHVSALKKASRLSNDSLSPEQRSALALAALADEAFALHFLEDTFAAGHVAGTWGNTAVRKGTHDYYNEHGVQTATWNGEAVVLNGDAYMRPEDAQRAAGAVRTSLEQVLDAASGQGSIPFDDSAIASPETLNVCQSSTMPAHAANPSVIPLLIDVTNNVPVPALAEGVGSLPRFQAELGPFIGLSAAAFGSTLNGGFDETQTTPGQVGGLEVAVRVGLGLEGVMNESGDGLVFLELGLRQDTASTMNFSDAPALVQTGAIGAAIPARTAYTVRLRMPFWLIPGDLVLGLPILAISPKTYAQMAVTASNGGLIPWQSGIATPVGRFQFVLGREVGVSFYGYWKEEDRLLLPPAPPGATEVRLIAFRSIGFDFPVLEYRPFRSFSLDQSSSVMVQLFAGFDVPSDGSVISPAGAPAPDFRTIYRAGVRIAFDWRHY